MNETAARAVPHIKYTPALEGAAITVETQRDGKGNPIRLCANVMDPAKVREALTGSLKWFEDPAFFAGEGATETLVCDHVIALSTLLREHHRAGNVPT